MKESLTQGDRPPETRLERKRRMARERQRRHRLRVKERGAALVAAAAGNAAADVSRRYSDPLVDLSNHTNAQPPPPQPPPPPPPSQQQQLPNQHLPSQQQHAQNRHHVNQQHAQNQQQHQHQQQRHQHQHQQRQQPPQPPKRISRRRAYSETYRTDNTPNAVAAAANADGILALDKLPNTTALQFPQQSLNHSAMLPQPPSTASQQQQQQQHHHHHHHHHHQSHSQPQIQRRAKRLRESAPNTTANTLTLSQTDVQHQQLVHHQHPHAAALAQARAQQHSQVALTQHHPHAAAAALTQHQHQQQQQSSHPTMTPQQHQSHAAAMTQQHRAHAVLQQQQQEHRQQQHSHAAALSQRTIIDNAHMAAAAAAHSHTQPELLARRNPVQSHYDAQHYARNTRARQSTSSHAVDNRQQLSHRTLGFASQPTSQTQRAPPPPPPPLQPTRNLESHPSFYGRNDTTDALGFHRAPVAPSVNDLQHINAAGVRPQHPVRNSTPRKDASFRYGQQQRYQPNSLDIGRTQANGLEMGRNQPNALDMGRTQQNALDMSRTQQNALDMGRTQQNALDIGRTQQNALDMGRNQQNALAIGRNQPTSLGFAQPTQQIEKRGGDLYVARGSDQLLGAQLHQRSRNPAVTVQHQHANAFTNQTQALLSKQLARNDPATAHLEAYPFNLTSQEQHGNNVGASYERPVQVATNNVVQQQHPQAVYAAAAASGQLSSPVRQDSSQQRVATTATPASSGMDDRNAYVFPGVFATEGNTAKPVDVVSPNDVGDARSRTVSANTVVGDKPVESQAERKRRLARERQRKRRRRLKEVKQASSENNDDVQVKKPEEKSESDLRHQHAHQHQVAQQQAVTVAVRNVPRPVTRTPPNRAGPSTTSTSGGATPPGAQYQASATPEKAAEMKQHEPGQHPNAQTLIEEPAPPDETPEARKRRLARNRQRRRRIKLRQSARVESPSPWPGVVSSTGATGTTGGSEAGPVAAAQQLQEVPEWENVFPSEYAANCAVDDAIGGFRNVLENATTRQERNYLLKHGVMKMVKSGLSREVFQEIFAATYGN